jgi:hypothetical protein
MYAWHLSLLEGYLVGGLLALFSLFSGLGEALALFLNGRLLSLVDGVHISI